MNEGSATHSRPQTALASLGQSIQRPVCELGVLLIKLTEETGRILIFMAQALALAFRPPFRFHLFFEQFHSIINRSLFIVAVTSLFSGMVFAVQFYLGFRLINADALVGPSSALSLARELAPVFTAVVVTGRSGAGIAAELGTMRVTEQIDALDVMAVNSVKYLATPRILAGTLGLPLLAMIFLLIGNFGAYLVGVHFLGIEEALFFAQLKNLVIAEDIYQGTIKALVFGLMFSTIGSYFGYYAGQGASAVGRAANKAVVATLVLILISDYFLTLAIHPLLYPEGY